MFLKTLALFGLPLIPTALAGSVHFGGKKHKPVSNIGVGNAGGSQGSVGLDTKQDMLYIADVSIGGTNYPVQLDTGSSDLWVKASPAVSGAELTSIEVSLKYGIGSAVGSVGTAPVEFAGFTVPKQAFLNVTEADNPIFQFGAVGIMGLGFTSLSAIDHAVNGTGADWGRSFLFNAFAQYPQEPNFIAFLLQRSTDPNYRTEGSFTLGEVEPGYEAVMKTTSISTFPIESPTRWTVLFEGYSINGGAKKPLAKSSVPDAPQDHGVMLLDSGTSLIYAPEALVTEIYGSIKDATFSSSDGMWILPCDSEIDFSFWIAGVEYPIHPLDLVLDDVVSDGIKDGLCAGSFLPQSLDVGASEFDILAGDSFLRSVYSLYDFGDFVDGTTKMGNPYVKLLSIVDMKNASAEFHAVRGGSGLASAGTGSATSTGSSSTFTIQDVYNKLESAVKYAGIALGVVGLGALLLGCLCGAAIMAVMNRRKSRREVVGSRTGILPVATARAGGNTDSTAFLNTAPATRGSYAPVSMYHEDTGAHTYEEPKYNHP